MLNWVRDLRAGFRLLLHAPGFAATAVLTLALGIGATTALFTVVNAVLLDPLPFPASRNLVQVWRAELPALTYGSASYLRYLDWRHDQRAFTDMGAWAPRGMTITGHGELGGPGTQDGPERVGGAVASASFFRVVGAQPLLGRWIADAEDQPGGEQVAVISESLWQRRFNGSRSALGAKLLIDGHPFSVVGVAPAGYSEVWRPDVWIPLGSATNLSNRGNNFLLSFGRLRDGETLDDARRSLGELSALMQRGHPEDEYTFTARPLYEIVTETATQGLWVLLGATGLLLLIACANVSNLLLARAAVRERDLAIRASLGASRRRLLAQVTAETMALGLAAGVIGTVLAWMLLRVFVTLAPNFPRVSAIGIDGRVLLSSVAIALAAGLIAGLAPAFHLLRSDLNVALRSGATRGATATRARAASRLLVVAEMALALALVATAGLTAKSLIRLQDQDLGMTREPVLTFSVGLPASVAPDDAVVSRLLSDFLGRVRAIPGVTHASAISTLPIAATGMNGPVRRSDQTDEHEGVPVTEFRAVMDDYFSAMGMHAVAGRVIDEHDRQGTSPVAVLNQTLATRLFPGVDPAAMIGRQIHIDWLGGGLNEVVGVVADVRSRRPDAPPDPEVYVPFAQAPTPTMSFVVRAIGEPSALTSRIRAALGAVTPDVAVANVRTMNEVVVAATRLSRLVSWLSVLFGSLAAVLAIVGVYGVMSCAVAQRRRELAIRAAVGANRLMLLALVVKEGLTLSGAGIIAGALLAFGASRVLRSLLYGVSATDPIVFGAAAAGLALIAFGGYAIPAMRAARVNPVDALRGE